MKIPTKQILSIFAFVCAVSCGCNPQTEEPENTVDTTTADVQMFMTTADKTMRFEKVSKQFNEGTNMNVSGTLYLKPTQTYQEIDGFGVAMTGSTCYNLLKMSAENRKKLLTEAFSVSNGMGYSYIRVSIGCSDFSLSEYSCCDQQGIENFGLQSEEVNYIIPVLKEVLEINPALKVMGTPWTAPRWMKVNNLTDLQAYNSWTSGQLNPAYYQDYATYFVKWVQAMELEGIPIESITVQNEPLNHGNSASMYMSWQEQRDFIKNALGPAFRANDIQAKIIAFDHNFDYDGISDQYSYPTKIYADAEASQYIDGAAYHAYGGSSTELTNVHNAYPDKNLYFTEMSIGTWNYSWDGDLMWTMREIGIGCLNRYCKAVIVWNFMLDDQKGPYRPGGCSTCYGAVDIDSKDYATLDRKTHFYFIGHMSKVLHAGSTRIGTSGSLPSGVYATAAENTDGTYGLVLQNDTDEGVKLTVDDGTHSFDCTLPQRSLTSCIWNK